jgi:hypothetical protein
MDETEMLKKIVKKKRRNSITIRYGMFGLSLGEETYQRLDKYCTKHNLYKSTLVKNLVIDYLDKAEQKDN